MKVTLRRRVAFSAGFVASGSMSASGHNYVCELRVSGEVDAATGMVVNIKDIDSLLRDCVVSRYNSRILNRDTEDFQDIPPTLENLTARIVRHVKAGARKAYRLDVLRLWQNPTFWATMQLAQRGTTDPAGEFEDRKSMISVTRAYEFSASHRLHSTALTDEENTAVFGKCNWPNGHGHNYEVEVTVAGEFDPLTGRLIDPDVLDALVESAVLKPFDHRHLNYDVPEFQELVPTSENLCIVIWNRIFAALQPGRTSLQSHGHPVNPASEARLESIVVRETARNHFEYRGL